MKYLLITKNIVKKIIRLTEKDLEQIVKRVLKEQTIIPEDPNKPNQDNRSRTYFDSGKLFNLASIHSNDNEAGNDQNAKAR